MDEDARTRWNGAASEWGRHAEQVDEEAAPVTRWLLDAIAPGPGDTVLELGAGPGGVGLQAARAVTPGGRVLITDIAPEMLAVARRRAHDRELPAVSFEVADAIELPLPDAGIDAAVCRFALPAMSDRARALSEMLRVLRPGGRLALAVWAGAAANPGTAAAMAAIGVAAGQRARDARPAIFSLADEDHLAALLTGAGFTDVRLEHVTGERRYESFERWWELRRRLPPGAQATWESLDLRAREDIERGLRERVAAHRRAGELVFAWDAVVASARRPSG